MKAIVKELIAIKRELQAIRNLLESSLDISLDVYQMKKAINSRR